MSLFITLMAALMADSVAPDPLMADSMASDSESKGNGEKEYTVIDTRQGPDSRFPPGFHFDPHDDELILYYLRRKIANLPLFYDVFNDVNLYEYHPATLVEKFKVGGEKRWYFFTPRDRKYPNGIRPNRKTVDGYWKATGVEKKIMYNAEPIGVRKALVFYTGKAGKGRKTDWIMYEYINQDPSNFPRRPDGTMKLDDWVLCTIQKKRGADYEKSGEPEEPSNAQESGEPEEPSNAQEATTSQSTKKPRTSQVPHVYYQVIHNNNGSHAPSMPLPNVNVPNDFMDFISSGDYHPSVQNFPQDILISSTQIHPSVQNFPQDILISSTQIHPSVQNFPQDILISSTQINGIGYQLDQTSEFGFENQQMISGSLYSSPMVMPGFENQQMIPGSLYSSPMVMPGFENQQMIPGSLYSSPGFEDQQMISGSPYSSPMVMKPPPPEDPLEAALFEQRVCGQQETGVDDNSIFEQDMGGVFGQEEAGVDDNSIFEQDMGVFGQEAGVDDNDDFAERFPPQDDIFFQPSQDNHSNDNFINSPDSKDSKTIL